MNSSNCSFERISNISVGIALAVFTLGFIVVSITILPIIGLVPAAAVAAGAFYFLSAPKSPECRIS